MCQLYRDDPLCSYCRCALPPFEPPPELLEGRLLDAPEEWPPPEDRPAEDEDRLPPEERELLADGDRGAADRLELLELGARTLDEGDCELGDCEPTLEVEVRGTIIGDEPPTR